MNEYIQIALDKARHQYGPVLPRAPLPLAPDRGLRVVDKPSWSALPGYKADLALLAGNRIVTAGRSDPAHIAFDRLRTGMLHEMRQKNWTSVAITSPGRGCGKTSLALNLAFSLAHQKDCRSLVIDIDLGQSRMAELLDMDNAFAMEDFLHGHGSIQDMFVRHGDNLALAANGRPCRFAAELLQSPGTPRILNDVKRRLEPTVVIYDAPPMLAGDEFMAFLPNVDCAILVAAAEATTLAEIDLCEQELAQKTNLLGVVLNKCRYPEDKYGY